MKYYLVGYNKNKHPILLFYDITDFEEQTVRGMTILTFTEEGVDYTFIDNGNGFKEVSNAAPDFDSYEVIDEKECTKRGLKAQFGANNAGASSTTGSSNTSNSNPASKMINVNTLGTVTLKSGKVVNILDPQTMQSLTPDEVKEVEAELAKQLGRAVNSGPNSTTAKARQTVHNTNSSGGCGGGSYSGGCGGGYSSRSYGGCGGSGGRSGC